jgi:hypothetical protein
MGWQKIVTDPTEKEELHSVTHLCRPYPDEFIGDDYFSGSVLGFEAIEEREREDEFRYPMQEFMATTDAKTKQDLLKNNPYFRVCYNVHTLVWQINEYYANVGNLLTKLYNRIPDSGHGYIPCKEDKGKGHGPFYHYRSHVENMMKLKDRDHEEGGYRLTKAISKDGFTPRSHWFQVNLGEPDRLHYTTSPVVVDEIIRFMPTITPDSHPVEVGVHSDILVEYQRYMMLASLIEVMPYGGKREFDEDDYVVEEDGSDNEWFVGKFGPNLFNDYMQVLDMQVLDKESTEAEVIDLTNELHDSYGLQLESDRQDGKVVEGNGLSPIIVPVGHDGVDTRIDTEDGVYRASPDMYYVFDELYHEMKNLMEVIATNEEVKEAHDLYKPGGEEYEKTREGWYHRFDDDSSDDGDNPLGLHLNST